MTEFTYVTMDVRQLGMHIQTVLECILAENDSVTFTNSIIEICCSIAIHMPTNLSSSDVLDMAMKIISDELPMSIPLHTSIIPMCNDNVDITMCIYGIYTYVCEIVDAITRIANITEHHVTCNNYIIILKIKGYNNE